MKASWLIVGCLAVTGFALSQTSRPADSRENLAVKTAASSATTSAPGLGEPPHWPIGLLLPPKLASTRPTKGPPRAGVLIWVPPDAPKVRAVILVPDNSDSKHVFEHAPLRAVAARHETAIVYLRSAVDTGVEGEAGPDDPTKIPNLLNFIADETGVREFRHAPWIVFGKSSRGKFPFRMAWLYPERTIASATYHGETPGWPIADYAKLQGQTILELNINGELEWGGTWFHHVRPALLNYRERQNWVAHQVVVRGVGHGDYADAHGSKGWGLPVPADAVSCLRVWDYIAMFIDDALTLRLPQGVYPTDGPVELLPVREDQGVFMDPFAVEEMFRIPHFPLARKDDAYVLDAGEPAVSGYAEISPVENYAIPEGVPVVPLEPGKSPSDWLVTEGMNFGMKNDPLTNLGGLEKLRPAPGDKVKIDDYQATFNPIAPKVVGRNGGINVAALKNSPAFTIVGYTVLDVPADGCYKARVVYSVAGRHRLVLNGMPVDDRQVVSLKKGKYPMLVVLRLTGVNWGAIEPSLLKATEDEIAMARQTAVEKARLRDEWLARQKLPPPQLVFSPADVPDARKKHMFRLPDKELADAWMKLHAAGPTSQPTTSPSRLLKP